MPTQSARQTKGWRGGWGPTAELPVASLAPHPGRAEASSVAGHRWRRWGLSFLHYLLLSSKGPQTTWPLLLVPPQPLGSIWPTGHRLLMESLVCFPPLWLLPLCHPCSLGLVQASSSHSPPTCPPSSPALPALRMASCPYQGPYLLSTTFIFPPASSTHTPGIPQALQLTQSKVSSESWPTNWLPE